jgi:ketosteroid isomerase-like protein
MREDLHASIARELWRATADSDSEGIRELLSPNVVWSTRSSGALNGSIEGPDAVIDRLARAGELVEDLTSEVIDIYSNPRGAVIHYRTRASRETRTLDTEVLLVLRILGGVVVGAYTMPVEDEQGDQFWSAH